MASVHSVQATQSVGNEKHPNHHRAYWAVFVALAIFTVVELLIPGAFQDSRVTMILLLVTVATIKACGVAAYYMHLKYEKGLLVGLAIAPLALCVILVLLMMSDVSAVDRGGWTIPAQAASASPTHR